MRYFNKQVSTGLKLVIAGSSFVFFAITCYPLLQHFFSQQEQLVNAKIHRASFHLARDIPALKELIGTAIQFCQAQGTTLEVKNFYYHEDTLLLKAQLEESIAWGSKAIVSIGNVAAQNVHHLLMKQNRRIPHIFTCISDPVTIGISQERYATGTCSTGIAEDPSALQDTFIASLFHTRPDAKKILAFYNVTNVSFQKTAASLATTLATKNVEVRALPVSNLNELANFAQTYITRDIDIVIVPRDMLIVSGLQSIVKACRMHGVTCFASDSHSVRNGAVAASCVEESDLGLLVGELLLKVVDEGIPPESIPITYFNTALLSRTYINPYEIKTQGLHNRGIYELMKSETKLEFLS